MAIQQRKQSSIILTFKVLQFVRQLRRRVKPRVLEASIDANNLSTRKYPALRTISEGLSRISIQDAKHSRRLVNRICGTRRPRKLSRSSLRAQGSVTPANRNLARHKLQQMLRSVDGKLTPTGGSFSSIAGNNKLFLQHNNGPIYEACSMNEHIQLLVAVQDAICILSNCRLQYGDDWLVAQGLDAGLDMDDNFIANYEHMLLRLRTDIIDALARKALEELLRGDHDKKQRKLLSWFTEFAGKPQPLSTAFPWTIKSSLAVLWGVCWMFYDRFPDEEAAQFGNGRVPLNRVLQNLDLPWATRPSSEYFNLGLQMIGSQPQHEVRQHPAANPPETWDPDLSSYDFDFDSGFRLPKVLVSQAVTNGPLRPQAAAQPSHNSNTYVRHDSQDFSINSPVDYYSPHIQGTAAPLTAFSSHLGSDHNQIPWQQYTSTLPQHSPRHLTTSAQHPQRVTEPAGRGFFTQPQNNFAAPDIYQSSHQPEASPLTLNSFNYYPDSHFIMTDALSSETTMQVPHKHERTTSINSNTDMPTPVSLSGPRSPLISPTCGERPQMITSPRTHSRGVSVDSSQDGDDDGSLRKNHSYKRAEEPPRNQEGRMMCKHQECQGLVFDRKCEWSKHMDKHDRPYKCSVKGCEKLQGFTYSGGLLRHEREVHKMHGGTKKSLFCPFHDCKRSSGAGFTRKENLAEHIRRVHRRTSMSADMHGLIIRRDATLDRSPIPESRIASESPYNRAMDFRERDEDDMSLKRKREGSDSGSFSDRGNEEMRAEIKRLRHENEEKDSRLRQLEQAVMALQQNHR